MTYTATVSSKGQLVVPSIIRKKMGLNTPGKKLIIKFDEQSNSFQVTSPKSIEDVRAKLLQKIKDKKIKPLLDPRAFYEKRPVAYK
jgi:bifunctional DNA-binding transcriptional regulator/antitoxin component of YhaV-PrlF toxin-antitoxin module